VSYEKVVILPPDHLKSGSPLTMYAIYAREENPPKGAEKIKWFILTTIELKSSKDALRCIEIYKLRWRIEEFHRVLKTGCKVEKYKQKKADRLKIIIAIDMVIAWRVMLLTLLGRESPSIEAEVVFSKHEILIMNLIAEKKLLQKINSVKDAIKVIASLGGYQNRASDPPPGFEIMCKGMKRLADFVYIAKLMISESDKTLFNTYGV
jgi:hypothetical protein